MKKSLEKTREIPFKICKILHTTFPYWIVTDQDLPIASHPIISVLWIKVELIDLYFWSHLWPAIIFKEKEITLRQTSPGAMAVQSLPKEFKKLSEYIKVDPNVCSPYLLISNNNNQQGIVMLNRKINYFLFQIKRMISFRKLKDQQGKDLEKGLSIKMI